MFERILRHEWRVLRSDATVWVVGGVFAVAIGYGVVNGARWVRFERAALRDAAAEQDGRYRQIATQASDLERAGRPVAGAAVVQAVKIPVIGGFGGGPWLDGRVRMAHTAIGYADRWIDSKTDTYFNGAKATLAAFTALIDDARAGRQIKG